MNPRQVAAIKRILKNYQAAVRTDWLYWAVPLIVAIAAFWFRWHWTVKTFATIAVVSGVIQHLADLNAVSDYKRRLESLSNEE